MRRVRFASASILLLVLSQVGIGGASPGSHGEDQAASLGGLPDPVVKCIRMEVGDDDLVSIEESAADGGDAYRVTWSAGGVTIETTLSAGGAVLSRRAVTHAEEASEDSSPLEDDDDEEDFEREITIDLVPEPARSAILREAGGEELAEVEMVIVRGELLYEADWITGDHEVGVRVSQDGRVLAREREELEVRDEER